MHNIFISYVGEDAVTAQQIAKGLEAASFSTWYYQRDGQTWGDDYLARTGQAIEDADGFVLILSKNSLNNPKQIRPEVIRAHEGGKLFLPILLGVTWEDFQKSQPGWRQAVGSSVALTWDEADPDEVLNKMIAGLHSLGIRPIVRENPPVPRPRNDPNGPAAPDTRPVFSHWVPPTVDMPASSLQPPVILHIYCEGHNYRFRIEKPTLGSIEPSAYEYINTISAKNDEQLRSTITQAIQTVSPAYSLEQLGYLMFSTLLPTEVQTFLRNYDGPLAISTNVPEIPWELFYDRSSKQFLGLKCAVGRRLLTQPMGSRTETICETEKNAFLLIGNPRNDLEGSEAEIVQLAELIINSGLQVEVLTGNRADFTSVSLGLQQECYLGIHYAGHAAWDRQDKQYALLLSDKSVLTTRMIASALRGSPFIFINACESDVAKSTSRKTAESWKTTEGIVEAFIQGGALSVIGTRWKVNDLIAREFSTCFYSLALAGVPVGEALRQTRQLVRKQYPKDTNWAAFVLYGDPLTRFEIIRPTPEPPDAPSTNSSPDIEEIEQKVLPPDKPAPTRTPDQSVMEQGLFLPDGRLNLAHFADSLRMALIQLPQEVQLVGHDTAGIPHLLSILLGITDGCTQGYFRQLGVEPVEMRNVLRTLIRSGEIAKSVPELLVDNFSLRGKKCLEQAEHLASERGTWEITEEDLLQAVLEIEEGVTAQILDGLGGARQKLLSLMRNGYVEPEQSLNLAEDAKQVLTLALNEAYTSGYSQIETPHFVIGLASYAGGRTVRGLQAQGIDPSLICDAMRELMPAAGSLYQGPKTLTHELFSDRMQELLAIAEAEALSAGVAAIGEVHLITGLAHVQGSLTAEVLRMLEIDLERLITDAENSPVANLSASAAGNGKQASILVNASYPYSARTSDVLTTAQTEASKKGFRTVETPFLCLGLIQIPEGSMGRGLKRQGIDPMYIANLLRSATTPAGAPTGQTPVEIKGYNHELLSLRVQNVLKIAEDEARANNAECVDDVHLVIGLLKSEGGQTTRFLQALGILMDVLLREAAAEAAAKPGKPS